MTMTTKLYLIGCIIQELQKTKDVAVTSMTGMASLQLGLGATTIHHWSGIMDCRHTHEDLMILFDTDDRFQSAKTRIIKSNVLVIDEIGMMSKTVLEMLEFVCRYVRGNTSVFGGLQVIANGDFKQLPPVPNRRFDDDGSFCFLSPLFQKTFPHHINLQQVVRQNEEDLVQAIHELCDGDPSKETEQLLRRLSRPLHNAVDVVKLFGTNFDADYINHEMLNSIDGNDKVYKSVDEGEVKLLMHSAAPKNLLLKVGAPVILIRNLEHNLFNGTRGVVTKLTEEGPVISVAGKNVPVPLTKFEVYDKTKKVTLATRLQYPVKLAFALTVHRAQGQTIPYLEVDCFSFFSPGQMGVAIGRAVNKKGLRVVNYNSAAAHLKHPGEVYDFYHQQILDFAQDLSCCRHTVDEDTSTLSQKSSEDYDNEEPYESPSSDSEADINLHRQCPWDVKEFLELNKGSPCVSDKPSGFGETEILKKHVQYLYAKVLEVMAKET
ncbi:uncharacterized protein [Argopecten irradians]|uniref:uncharacterized protein n=1 Tax=Argopecten irradians TaxID=31199 RepID=UPI00371EF7F0